MQWLPISETKMSTENDVSMGQIISVHQAEKISKEISKTINISLIAMGPCVRRIMENWNNNSEEPSMRKYCRRKTIWIDSFVIWQKQIG